MAKTIPVGLYVAMWTLPEAPEPIKSPIYNKNYI